MVRTCRTHLFSPLILVVFASFLLAPRSSAGASEDSRRQGLNAAERAIGAAAAATGSTWEAIQSWIKLRLMNLPPPATARVSRSKSETVKEAAARTLEVGKSAAESSAKSAASVAGTLVEKTASKVKRSADEDSDL